MMTRDEVAAEYTLNANGTVSAPGKFEGEPWYVVALWNAALEGCSDLLGWLQTRVRQMDILTKEAKDRGETVTFSEAAATSVRAP